MQTREINLTNLLKFVRAKDHFQIDLFLRQYHHKAFGEIIRQGQVEIARYLLDNPKLLRYAELNERHDVIFVPGYRNKNIVTPLAYAAFHQQVPMMELLMQYGNKHQVDDALFSLSETFTQEDEKQAYQLAVGLLKPYAVTIIEDYSPSMSQSCRK